MFKYAMERCWDDGGENCLFALRLLQRVDIVGWGTTVSAAKLAVDGLHIAACGPILLVGQVIQLPCPPMTKIFASPASAETRVVVL